MSTRRTEREGSPICHKLGRPLDVGWARGVGTWPGRAGRFSHLRDPGARPAPPPGLLRLPQTTSSLQSKPFVWFFLTKLEAFEQPTLLTRGDEGTRPLSHMPRCPQGGRSRAFCSLARLPERGRDAARRGADRTQARAPRAPRCNGGTPCASGRRRGAAGSS